MPGHARSSSFAAHTQPIQRKYAPPFAKQGPAEGASDQRAACNSAHWPQHNPAQRGQGQQRQAQQAQGQPRQGQHGQGQQGQQSVPNEQSVPNQPSAPEQQPAPNQQPAPQQQPTAEVQAKPNSPSARYIRSKLCTYQVVKPIMERKHDPRSMTDGVYLIKNIKNGHVLVEKRLTLRSLARQQRIAAEIAALRQIVGGGAPYSVNFLVDEAHDTLINCTSLILEHCDRGSLCDVIEKSLAERMQLTENYVWHVLAGLSKALLFIHYGFDVDRAHIPEPTDWNTLCHLDIKPANVFLSSVNTIGPFPRVVLGDFGCVVTYKDILSGKAYRDLQKQGTPGWFPPEIKASSFGGWDGKYGMPTDIWQAGAVMQSMCRLVSNPDMTSVEKGRACGRLYSPELNGVVNACMLKDIARRPTAKDLAMELKAQTAKRGLPYELPSTK
ncbi:hypothetical protein BAUCODRAFT_30025 [Baudoinia panamericana UAMH 10762]|uniref:non-specific serine/threonine protein kinase n=1 Tax=Baudoinia panamericana (strain UAMH 10762) TaxID=717646 RepID=M2LY71_BAUPA|nr:uncharacterized protein BAUCODRAFT_30025 [Baudoinia panamericana UAMH 10762]EMC99652.1 hypothetical protein BAUCODRAFT_30025 [Baudoinia panamericana UAMH 10762]